MSITFPTPSVLCDKFIQDFNTAIQAELSWLNNPLGKIQETFREHKGAKIRFPAIHTDGGEYIEVFPNDTLTNYSWFDFEEYEYPEKKRYAKMKVTCRVNFYLDLRKIYGNVASRNSENAKNEIINAINAIAIKSAAIRITAIREEWEDIYEGYDLGTERNDYLMQPYYGVSFNCDVWLKNNNNCNYGN